MDLLNLNMKGEKMTYKELEELKKEKNTELNYIKNIIKTSKDMRDCLLKDIHEIEKKQLELVNETLLRKE